jgi:hypothetical protein
MNNDDLVEDVIQSFIAYNTQEIRAKEGFNMSPFSRLSIILQAIKAEIEEMDDDQIKTSYAKFFNNEYYMSLLR